MRSICADSIVPQPWQNGGGRTRELLAWPDRAHWSVRVSLADIEGNGPFSSFPGVQRWFVVVSGHGVQLRFADCIRTVATGDEPLSFDGGPAPGCSLVDGPTQDLNLMVRGGAGAMRAVRPGVVWDEVFQQRGLFARCAGRWSSIGCDSRGGGGEPTHGYADGAPTAGNGRLAGDRRGRVVGGRVEPGTLAWDLGQGGLCFTPDPPTHGGEPCGWWLGFSPGSAGDADIQQELP